MDDAVRRAFRGSLASVLNTVLALAMGMVVPYVALRAWSPEEFSTWASSFALVGLLGTIDVAHQIFVGNAYTVAHFRGISDAAVLLRNGVRWAIVIGMLKAAIISIIVVAIPTLSSWRTAYPLILAHCLTSGVVGMAVQAYRPHGEYATSLVLMIGWQILATGLALGGIVVAHLNPFGALTVFAIGKFSMELAIIIYTIRHFALFRRWGANGWIVAGARNVAGSGYYLVTNGFDALVLQGSIVLMERTAGGVQTALYVTARTLANAVLQNVNLLLTPISHELVRMSEAHDKIGFRAVCGGAVLALTAAIGAGVVVLAGVGTPLFIWWTKARFGAPGVVLVWLAAAAFVRTAVSPVFVFFQNFNRTAIITASSVVRCVLFFGIVSIGPHSAAGFAIAAGIGEFFAAGVLVVKWYRDSDAKLAGGTLKLILPVIVAASAGFVILLWAPSPGTGIVLAVLATMLELGFGWRLLGVDVQNRVLANVRRLQSFHFS